MTRSTSRIVLAPCCVLMVVLGCEPAPPLPAVSGTPSAEGAALAGELEGLATQLREHALAIQAASDPERAIGGGPPPDIDAMKRELEAVQARMAEIEAQLLAMEELASSPSSGS